LIDLELAGNTYYISDYVETGVGQTDNGIVYNSGNGDNTYQSLGNLMDVGPLEADINPGEVATSIIVSGIDPSSGADLKTIALGGQAKGGNVIITRGLSSTGLGNIVQSNLFYPAYKGVVRNINFAESFPQMGTDHTDTVIFECSNLFGVKRSESRGRKTNPDDFNDYYRFTKGLNRDAVMDRVSALNGKKWAFGKTG
jgi:hypothetical protein